MTRQQPKPPPLKRGILADILGPERGRGGMVNIANRSSGLRRGLALPLLLGVGLAGCAYPDHGLNKKDYYDLRDRQPPAAAVHPEAVPPIPELQPILAAPPPPSTAQRLVTLTVTDPSIPVRDVLLELARKVGVDIDLDQNVGGGIIISAKDRPFLDVIDRICEQANLRCSFKDNVLHVAVDDMYYQTYHLDMLNSIRTTTTDITSSTSISSLIQGGGGGGGSNTSTSDVKSTSEADLWKEVDANVKQILLNTNPRNQPITSSVNGDVTVVAAPPPPSGAPPVGRGGKRGSGAPLLSESGVSHQEAPPPAGGEGAQPNSQSLGAAVAGQAAAVNEGIQAVAGYKERAAAAAALDAPPTTAAVRPAAAAAVNASGALYSINKQAGMLSVFGTGRQQKLIKAYLDKVLAKAGAQVLIEAKVVEVVLSDQYSTGIDWTALRQNLKGTGFGISSNTPSTSSSSAVPALPVPGDLGKPFGSLGFNAAFTTFGGDLAAMINLIKTYGNTRTLSSPRLTVMNNQTAMLKVAENHVYYKLTATVTATPSTAGAAASQTATYSSSLQTLPIGLVMTVQPSIDLDKDQVTLGLRPTVTAWPGNTVSDPAVALGLASACGSSTTGGCSQANINSAIASSSVPVVDVREMDSVVTVPSGAVIVMGGLMQEVVNKQDSGVPGAGDLPVIGNLFRANNDQTQVTELVVFLKATVVHGTDSVDWADKDLYQRYMHDPRPWDCPEPC